MARPRKHDGVICRRNDGNVWWMRYRDKDGSRRLESTKSTDWEEAQRQMRERLAARNNNSLEILRKGKKPYLNEWADFSCRTIPNPPFEQPKHTRQTKTL